MEDGGLWRRMLTLSGDVQCDSTLLLPTGLFFTTFTGFMEHKRSNGHLKID